MRQGKERAATLTADIQRQRTADATAAAKEKELTIRREKIAAHRTIFTVDTELDEILTAFKLTFMCLCSQLMARYLGTKMELDTLIRGVLTLPGERAITPGVETIRIFRQPRDRDLMPAVEQACRLMTERGLFRANDSDTFIEVLLRGLPPFFGVASVAVGVNRRVSRTRMRTRSSNAAGERR